MTLTGAKSISEITQDSLVQGLGKELPAALAPMAKGNAARVRRISAILPRTKGQYAKHRTLRTRNSAKYWQHHPSLR